MADFVAVLTKTIDGLGDRNTADMRKRVYEKARKAIADKLAAMTPAPPAAAADRQYRLLDDAISVVEARYAPAPSATFAPPTTPPPPITTLRPLFVPPTPATASQEKPATRDPLEDFLASVQDDPAPMSTSRPVVETPRRMDPPLVATTPKAPPPPDPILTLGNAEAVPLPAETVLAQKRSNSGAAGLVYALLGLAAIGGAGYAGYLYKDQLQSLLGISPSAPTAPETPAVEPATETPAAPAQTETPKAETTTPESPAAAALPKFTQRLTPEGQEIDAGPGAKPTDVGEGQTVAEATTPSTAPATPAPTDPAQSAEVIPVGQKAIFYEEKTGTEAGTADQGAVVWSVVQDSPGLDQPEEPAIRGDLTIPARNIKLRITIKRNGDKSLPASHIIEMAFSTPADFPGGAIEAVQRMALKDTEQAPGSPLVGVPAAFGDGFFLIALTDEKTAIDTNMTLLQRQNWFDIPVAYRTGRRALLSFEKGLAGDKVFQEVIKAWEAKAPAAPAPAATEPAGG
jgi:hypothetical protein